MVDYGRGTGWNHKKIATEGPFRVADVGMTFILLRATRDLLALVREAGDEEHEAELEECLQQLEGCADYLWDDAKKTFCSRDAVTGAHSGVVTSASFLYAYAGVGDSRQRQHMQEHWERISSKSRFTVPSYDPDENDFDDLRYWRGPVWIIVNYLVARGFDECGMRDHAERIRKDSARLIAEHGFREAFSPETGAGTGGDAFSWTAAMWLAWCRMPVS
jgi:glycogen debranching enzyme